ncbi:MAG: hypothetical protein AB8G16_17910 [Gammaproteobacteria bacterium]
MRGLPKKTIHWLLAMMLAAQLCSVAHAAEFGSGPHSHGDVVCHLGVANDDDPGIGRTTGLSQVLLSDQSNACAIPAPIPTGHTALLPPSTGPPPAP